MSNLKSASYMTESFVDNLLDQDEKKILLDVSKALSNKSRLEIIAFLKTKNTCITNSIVEHLTLAQSTVSQHLTVLKNADIISGEIIGPAVCYCLNNDTLDQYQKILKKLTEAQLIV